MAAGPPHFWGGFFVSVQSQRSPLSKCAPQFEHVL